MKIAYVGSPELFSRGASSIHVMKMCQAMAQLGLEVELLLPYYTPSEDIFDYYGIQDRFPIRRIFPSIGKGWPRHVTHGLMSAIHTGLVHRDYDLIVTRNLSFTYIATRLAGLKTIYDAHHPLVNAPARRLFNGFKSSPNLVRFSTNSHGLARIYLELGLPAEKLVVAPNGVDLARFTGLGGKAEARKRLSLPADTQIVCYSGNMYEGRGLEMLADAAAVLRDTQFVLVGGLESDIARVRGMARTKGLGNFDVTGFVQHSEVPYYLAAADVLVLPYTSRMTIKGGAAASEFTSPIKLFEYMAAGRPIVTTALPSVLEILEDGVNAVVVDSDSLDSLVAGIQRALGDRVLAERISTRAAEDAKKYTWQARVKRLLIDLSRN